MDRPSSLAKRSRQRHPARFQLGSRALLRLGTVALLLAFAHIWENVTLAEMRTRIDKERASQEALTARLRQLTSQLAQWTARAENASPASAGSAFVIPRDGQVVLVSEGVVGTGSGARLASASANRSLWDWVAGAAEAESRGTGAGLPEDENFQ